MALDIADDEDAFETVAVTWSQPETAVMLSMFEFYGIPAYATGRWHASVEPLVIVALQGMQIRVHHVALDDALDLLADVAERPAALRPFVVGDAAINLMLIAIASLVAIIAPEPFNWVGWLTLSFIIATLGPTRTASTFLLWKRSREALPAAPAKQ